MKIGPYELVERIGVGGMAEVYKARQTGEGGFERIVAVKRILPNVAEDENFVAMFIDEAKIAVQLSHPNIAQVYDLGRDGETLFIAIEYVHGRDMGAICQRQLALGRPPPIPFVIHVATKIAEALSHAHTAKAAGGRPLNLIHRDVSPQNVLVSFEGAVKVIDFGLAKATGRTVHTQVGVVKGKLAYLSAEQARGESIDSRSDIFSLGICAFEWLTGRRLFYRASDIETVIAVQRGEVPSIRGLRPEVPPALEKIVRRALEPDPARRYQSAAEMHDELLSFAYETGNTMGRRAFTEYIRSLFPDDMEQEPAPRQAKRDTMPSAPYEIPPVDLLDVDTSLAVRNAPGGFDDVEEVDDADVSDIFEDDPGDLPHADELLGLDAVVADVIADVSSEEQELPDEAPMDIQVEVDLQDVTGPSLLGPPEPRTEVEHDSVDLEIARAGSSIHSALDSGELLDMAHEHEMETGNFKKHALELAQMPAATGDELPDDEQTRTYPLEVVEALLKRRGDETAPHSTQEYLDSESVPVTHDEIDAPATLPPIASEDSDDDEHTTIEPLFAEQTNPSISQKVGGDDDD